MIGLKHITFLITAHVLLFGAANAGIVDNQGGGANPNKAFVDKFLSGQFSDTVQTDQDSNVVSDTVGVAAKAMDGIGFIAGVLFSPLKLAVETRMPFILSLLFQAIFTFWEGAVILSFIRGKNL